jgi:hypothetical protein
MNLAVTSAVTVIWLDCAILVDVLRSVWYMFSWLFIFFSHVQL